MTATAELDETDVDELATKARKTAALKAHLARHCSTVKADADGTFSLPGQALQMQFGVGRDAVGDAIAGLIEDGLIVRVRISRKSQLSLYARPAEWFDRKGSLITTCSVCGCKYERDGPVSCCPRTLTYPHIKRRKSRAQS